MKAIHTPEKQMPSRSLRSPPAPSSDRPPPLSQDEPPSDVPAPIMAAFEVHETRLRSLAIEHQRIALDSIKNVAQTTEREQAKMRTELRRHNEILLSQGIVQADHTVRVKSLE